MNTSIPFRLRRPGVMAATCAALACALTMSLAACGSSSGSSATGSTGASTSAASTTGITASGTGSKLATVMNPVTSYTLPTTTIDVKALAGKSIYYIPITQQSPLFTVVSDAMAVALKGLGMTLHICDGAANPSSTSACISQAVGAGAAGIVTDSIPYGFAANAFTAAQAKGVPVLITNQLEDASHPTGKYLAYMPGPAASMLEAVARWVISDSAGKGVVVANEVSDNQSSIDDMNAALTVFKIECPKCKVVVNKISAANFAQVGPSTSAAIDRTQGTDYVISEFDSFLQATASGIQATGQASSIKLVSTTATLSALQSLAKQQPPVADVGVSLPFYGYVDVDAILRMILNQPVPSYDIPFRLFDATNVKDVTLSSAAEASGEWFGPTDFASKFKALWQTS